MIRYAWKEQCMHRAILQADATAQMSQEHALRIGVQVMHDLMQIHMDLSWGAESTRVRSCFLLCNEHMP